MAYLWKTNPYFTPTAYVAVSGSDLNDGTADKPYRTLQKCKDAGKWLIQIGSGVYRENPNFTTQGTLKIFADGIVVIDSYLINGYFYGPVGLSNLYVYNVVFANFTSAVANTNTVYYGYKCTYKNCTENGFIFSTSSEVTNNVYIRNSAQVNNSGSVTYPHNYKQNTHVNTKILYNTCYGQKINNIYYNCEIQISADVNLDYSLFYNCTFKISNESSFTALTGADAAAKLANLRSRWLAKFPSSVNNFTGCSCEDPLFNNATYDDYSLSPTSPARHMKYDGTFIGAFDVAYKIKSYAADLGNAASFYNASKSSNINASDTKLSLVRNADGSSVGGGAILTKPMDLGFVYELRTILIAKQLADRNREWIDTHADIDMASPINPGTSITVGETYVVEGGSVVYNSVTYSTRSKFIAVTGQTSFTSSDGGYLFLVTETPMRPTCEMRIKQSIVGTVINAGTNVLTQDNWYTVVNNSITWNGLTVPVGDSFQAIAGQLSFSGSGGCVEIFANTDTWYEFEIGEKPMCKRIGDVSSGAIAVGTDGYPLTNGHKEFYTTANKARTSFIVYARYIQYRITFQNKMLK